MCLRPTEAYPPQTYDTLISLQILLPAECYMFLLSMRHSAVVCTVVVQVRRP